ncbi:MAG: ABC transporter permease [Candidatus Thermoplasmatota archaeon]|nr:ABC transporter permease [Candidatus Thermoplasmatota archaeon]MCL5989493.1 ABC transporter permease [Candidatus Thermoplasmatota archaeon]
MRDFLYDLKRTLTGKFTIIMIVLVILLSIGMAYVTVTVSQSPSSAPPSAVSHVLPDIYPVKGGYKIVDYAVNGYGQPVPHLAVSSYVFSFNGSSSSKTVLARLNGTTDSSGFVSFSYNTDMREVNYSYSAYYQYGSVTVNSTAFFETYHSNGKNATFFSSGFYHSNGGGSISNISLLPDYLYVIPVSSTTSKEPTNFLIYYAGPNSTAVPTMKVYFNYTNYISISAETNSNMTYLKTITGRNATIVTVPLNSSANNKDINVGVFASNDSAMGMGFIPYSVINSALVITELLQLPYEFLIPILGIFSAYFYYSKDKASGVLESIIVRPVTKGRLFASRFTAGVISFFVALIISLGFVDLVVLHYTGSALSSGSFFSILLSYFATAIAYSGIIYLISQFVKSQGAIIGIGIGLFFLLAIFWGDIAFLLPFVLHVNLSVPGAYSIVIALSSISPSFIPTMNTYLMNGLYTGDGVSLGSLLFVGIAWAIIPAVASFLLARSRD